MPLKIRWRLWKYVLPFYVSDVEQWCDGVEKSVPDFLPKLVCVWVALGERGRMADGLLEAVRGLWLVDPGLGPKPLLASLREDHGLERL